ncbi:hypothetical protein J2T56_002363 [Natronobacillus azotifigens]|uniref:Uncharacterized protein n=1 Tax=Natronobacillus azotifigens TaxID=472978 RepID=A0A9J6RFA3_9BACI|nr:hypothetical protein [Natronobacillus azotifigens]MCZ0704117.1 hypothetical protein [Natronobacillus azotifigens]
MINILIAFQSILLIFIVLFGISTIGSTDNDQRVQCVSVAIAAILAMVVTFYV